ncbi:alpha/beta fold hydrolase [Frigidibacter oleivorans]|uniref:alpha/beta fold hydrolase n=1 Tax=Frigidibacter oleivorans TaxID=2487129 RepID=UPI000F8CEA12|nr:alpha/beta fold hydrolase [Frigidibacter oleivorans]
MSATRHIALPDGTALNIRIDGAEGAPWVVLSNSVMTDLTVWDDTAAALAPRFRVLRYDQRGHGQSDVTAGPLAFADYGADLSALMDTLGIARAVLVGLSMGVPSCLAAHALRPDRTAAFVAVDGVARSAPGREAFWTERRETARAGGMAAIAAGTAERWLPGTAADSPLRRRLEAMIAATPVEGFAAATHALAAYDLSAVLPSLAGRPVLGIAGAEDGAIPAAVAAQFGALPGARTATIAGAGHLPNFQAPAAFADALTGFLDQAAVTTKETD